MFKKRTITWIIVGVIFTLVGIANNVYTHSGRTDKYGGHNDRINGGYHYHNSGTVPRRPSAATAPSRTTTPDVPVLLSEGNKPYTPTRLEWLALDLNAGVPTSSIRYYTTTKANTIVVNVFYDSTITLKERQEIMNYGKKAIRNEANVRGWSWLKLEEDYQELK